MATQISSPLISSLTIEQRRVFLEYAKHCADLCGLEIGTFRALLTYRDRAYQRQLNTTAEHIKALQANMRGEARKLQDLTVPIVMPQVESAVAYQTGVFLSQSPIFGVISTPQNMDAALQFETALQSHAIQYGWARELIKVFRNGFKYNFGPALIHWKKTAIQQVTTSTDNATAGLAKLQRATYGGNCITSIDPYNCFMDMRVDPSKHHEEGEFFGWNVMMSRMMFKRFVTSLDPARTTRTREAFESSYQGAGGDSSSCKDYYVPEVNKTLNINSLMRTGTNWLAWVGAQPQGRAQNDINYKDYYLVTPFICRACPSDFGARGNNPTIYFGYIVNWKEVVYVEEVISAHDYLPVLIMQPNEDGLGYQTQSMLDNALPFQDMSSALWNMTLESKRRQVFDRLIYNEKYIDKKDIDPASSVARIPLRNASMFKGEDIGKAVYQIPYRDENSGVNLQMSEMISQMADQASGQNKVDRGQFQKGNKTVTEFQTTMTNSNSRQQLSSMMIEGQFMTPAKEIIRANTLQHQTPGKLLNRGERQEVEIDPVKLREQILEFKMTDGLLPAEKMLNMELMTVFLQTAQAMPVVMSEYDVIGMFLYWAKLKGAYWLDDFKRDQGKQQQFLNLYKQTSEAQNAQPPQQQIPGV